MLPGLVLGDTSAVAPGTIARVPHCGPDPSDRGVGRQRHHRVRGGAVVRRSGRAAPRGGTGRAGAGGVRRRGAADGQRAARGGDGRHRAAGGAVGAAPAGDPGAVGGGDRPDRCSRRSWPSTSGSRCRCRRRPRWCVLAPVWSAAAGRAWLAQAAGRRGVRRAWRLSWSPRRWSPAISGRFSLVAVARESRCGGGDSADHGDRHRRGGAVPALAARRPAADPVHRAASCGGCCTWRTGPALPGAAVTVPSGWAGLACVGAVRDRGRAAVAVALVPAGRGAAPGWPAGVVAVGTVGAA